MKKKASNKKYNHVRGFCYSRGWSHLAHLNNDINQPLATEYYEKMRAKIKRLIIKREEYWNDES